MPTLQKTEIINDLTHKFQNSSGIYFTRYSGMNVVKVTELRRKFRENEVSYLVSKNTLTKIAANNAGYEDKLNDLLSGQIGIAYVSGDPAAPARVICNFEKENKNVRKISIKKNKNLKFPPNSSMSLSKLKKIISD